MSTWRKVVYCLAFVAGVSFTASATTYHVTPGATAESGDGLSWGSPVTLTEAIALAANDDVILCKAGEYPTVAASGSGAQKASFTISKPVTIRGGLKGTDDVTLDADQPYSTLSAPAAADIIYLKATEGVTVFENLKLTGVSATAKNNLNSAIYKTGAGSVEIRNCQIVNNQTNAKQAQGLYLSGAATSTAVISNCLFAGNVTTGYASEPGQALYLSTFKEVVLDSCSFVTNGVSFSRGVSNLAGSGAVRAPAIYASNAPIKARNCSFVANRNTWLDDGDTGCVMLEGAGGETVFENCKWIGNSEVFGKILNANYGYTASTAGRGGALSVKFSSNDYTLTLKNCTVAMNMTDSPGAASGVTVAKGRLNVIDSIIANNIRPNYAAAGADLMVSGAAEATLSNVQLTANDASSFVVGRNSATPPVMTGLRFGDPLFVTPLSDVTAGIAMATSWTYEHPYYTAAILPTLVAADCGLTAESPALGLGASVATDPAIPTGTPSFGSINVAFPAPYTDPLVTVTMAGEDAYLAMVVVMVKVAGETKATKSFFGIRSGDELTFAPPIGLDANDAVTVEVTATVPGIDPVTDTASGTVPAEAVKAPWVGVAGEANVIYVREGADGAGTGLNWADAFPNVETAFASLSAERTEIWVAGSFAANAGIRHTEPVASFAVRGGFAGGESDPSERPQDGLRSVIDFAAVKSGITIANGAGIKATFDRLEFRNTSEGAIAKSGAGNIEVTDCRFLNCNDDSTRTGRGPNGGNALCLNGSADTQAKISGCVFEGCMSTRDNKDKARGIVLNVSKFAQVELTDCLFLTNGVPWSPFRNNLNNVTLAFDAVYVSGAPVTATRCRFIGNHVATRGDAACFALRGASGGSIFDHCLWTANSASHSAVNGPGGYSTTATLLVNLTEATDEVDIIGCTIAYNLVDGTQAAGGVSIAKGAVTIRDSIFYGNGRTTGGTSGNDLAVWSSGSADIAYSIFTAKPGTYDSITTATAENLTIDYDTTFFADDGYDPLFVTPLATAQGYFTTTRSSCRAFKETDKQAVCNFDLHIKSPGGYWLNDGTVVKDAETPTSPALDSGDPASDFSNEPEPNGGCVNMGFYGNTTNASMTAAVELKVTDVRTTYPTNWSRPHIEVDLGGSPGYTASVTIYCYTNGVLITSRAFPNHVYGDTVAWDPAIYLVAGDTLVVRAVASAKGSDDAEGPASETEVEGEIPPWNGKGGGAGVIHVREGADGDATGLNWTDAYPTLEGVTNLFANGNLPADYREIWIAGKITRVITMAKILPQGQGSFAVRGGFTGSENASTERPGDGSMAVIDGANAFDCLRLNYDSSVTAEVERISFERGRQLGLRKQGAGDLVVRNCRFFGNLRNVQQKTGNDVGHGTGADITGSSGSTYVILSNCVFEGNGVPVDGSAYENGYGVYLEGLKGARISDCQFYTNGVPWNAGLANVGDAAFNGAAICANGAPLEVSNCRFVANRAGAGRSNPGGIVALIGNCDGSSFVNCLWAGNECVWRGYYTDGGDSTSGSGALCLSLGASNQVVTVKNCTIAYNMADIGSTSAGITITKGTLELVDSIVYGNFGALFMHPDTGRDLALVSSNAYARVRYSLIGTPGVTAVSSLVPENVSTNASDGVILGDPLLVTEYASVTNMLFDQGDDRYTHLHHLRFSDAALESVLGFNVHLRGGTGYLDETTGETVKDWTRRRYGNSPAIDAGDPAVRCVEPHPNGCRVNMGFYGNTEWATMSRDGLLIFVK